MTETTAIGAVEHELSKLPLQIRLHLEEFEAQHLRVDRDLMGAAEAGFDRLVD